MALPAPEPRRPPLPGPRRRRQALVQQRCPEWTDHNVSDPGVTLIETFAYMTDQLLYRLNRVPDRHYLASSTCIGVRLFPPTAAHGRVTFWLVRAAAETGHDPGRHRGRHAAHRERRGRRLRHRRGPARSRRARSSAARSQVDRGRLRDHARSLADGQRRSAASTTCPSRATRCCSGLVDAVPCVRGARSRFDCRDRGRRRRPATTRRWSGRRGRATAGRPARSTATSTGGLNRAGDVVLHVPAGHAASVIDGPAGGLVCAAGSSSRRGRPARLHALAADQPSRGLHHRRHDRAPSTPRRHATRSLGVSEGVPGQRFPLARRPVRARRTAPVRARGRTSGDGWRGLGAGARLRRQRARRPHFMLDAHRRRDRPRPGGPRRRTARCAQYGRRAADGRPLRVRALPHRRRRARQRRRRAPSSGCVSRSRTSPRRQPGRRPRGGVDGETIEEAKLRGPLQLRTAQPRRHARGLRAPRARGRARGRPRAARRRRRRRRSRCACGCSSCRTWSDTGGRFAFEQLVPADEMLERIARHLDERRLLGARVVVEPPSTRASPSWRGACPPFG